MATDPALSFYEIGTRINADLFAGTTGSVSTDLTFHKAVNGEPQAEGASGGERSAAGYRDFDRYPVL
jgi:hypothetical protein